MTFIKWLFKKLNLWLILLAYLVYFILFLCQVDVKYGSLAFAITHIVVFTTLFYSVFRIIFPINKTEKSKSTTKKTDKTTVKTQNKEDKTSDTTAKTETGKFYQVKQNPNYYFKEFQDRYELYKKTETGMQYVKTDYKKDLKNNG